ncbi:transcription factor bHLH112-like [Solanum dulcamara]|uniref:transcription factor bHLH112-like n=1 Tax=Solanum dulcamara TaxID=45834 RepID=UPI002485C3F1|nr:transcription factor bHLH112-like [Solanum dulcamara]
MADEIFQDGVYGESWWINSTKNIFSLSSSTNCGQYFTCPSDQFLDMKNRSNNDDYYSSSDDSMVFQELPKNHNLSSMDNYDSNLQILGIYGNSSSPDWNHSLNDSMLQENLNSSQNCLHHHELKRNFSSIISEDNSLIKPIMNQDFSNYYSDLLQTLFDSTNPHQDQLQPQQSFNYASSTIKHRQNFNGVAPSLAKQIHNSNIKEIREPTYKRSRIETPSPLPTFKVRKEKLGDRITALQQLVSPFGKTDTASVLQEAIEYINFLHDQVNVILRTPHMKNGLRIQHQQVKEQEGLLKQDLRSKGLCLVPISSTFPVAAEITMDFWTPTLGRTSQ